MPSSLGPSFLTYAFFSSLLFHVTCSTRNPLLGAGDFGRRRLESGCFGLRVVDRIFTLRRRYGSRDAAKHHHGATRLPHRTLWGRFRAGQRFHRALLGQKTRVSKDFSKANPPTNRILPSHFETNTDQSFFLSLSSQETTERYWMPEAPLAVSGRGAPFPITLNAENPHPRSGPSRWTGAHSYRRTQTASSSSTFGPLRVRHEILGRSQDQSFLVAEPPSSAFSVLGNESTVLSDVSRPGHGKKTIPVKVERSHLRKSRSEQFEEESLEVEGKIVRR